MIQSMSNYGSCVLHVPELKNRVVDSNLRGDNNCVTTTEDV